MALYTVGRQAALYLQDILNIMANFAKWYFQFYFAIVVSLFLFSQNNHYKVK